MDPKVGLVTGPLSSCIVSKELAFTFHALSLGGGGRKSSDEKMDFKTCNSSCCLAAGDCDSSMEYWLINARGKKGVLRPRHLKRIYASVTRNVRVSRDKLST